MITRNTSLRTKLSITVIGGIVVLAALFVGIGLWQSSDFSSIAHEQVDDLVTTNLSQSARDMRHMVEGQAQLLERTVDQALALNRQEIGRLGQPALDTTHVVTWDAVNQFSLAHTSIKLPSIRFGSTLLTPNTDPKVRCPVIEPAHGLLGTSPTLFQRLPGDLGYIRVATWVVKNGKRQIGTYIPKIQPDGKPNPVVAAVEAGKTYRGVAFVVDRWMVTGYEPLRDASGTIIGINSLGTSVETVPALRNAVQDAKIGKTGNVYVLGAVGDKTGKYLLAPKGEADGKVLLQDKDLDGQSYVQKMVDWAHSDESQKDDSFGTVSFRDKDGLHIARLAYFKPWDWLIVIDGRASDYKGFAQALDGARTHMLLLLIVTGLVVAALGAGWAATWGKTISRPIALASEAAGRIAQGNLSTDLPPMNAFSEVSQMREAFADMLGSLRETAHVADELASGNLEIDVQPRSPEDQYGNALQRMVKGLRTLIRSVAMSVAQVESAGNELAEASHSGGLASTEVASGTTRLASTATLAARAMSALGDAVEKVSNGDQQQHSTVKRADSELARARDEIAAALKEAKDMSQLASNGAQLMEANNAAMSGVQEKSIRAKSELDDLDAKGRQIGDIIATIESIAQQTNLLALNAAIEAARAGEHGMGFAVVAAEVRKLAEDSRVATERVSSLVSTVRGAVANVVQTVMGTMEQVEEGGQRTLEMEQGLVEILNSIERVTSRLDQVDACSQSASSAMSELISVTDGNHGALTTMRERTTEVTMAVHDVAAVSEEIAATAEELSAAIEEVSASASALRDMATNLDRESSKFNAGKLGELDRAA